MPTYKQMPLFGVVRPKIDLIVDVSNLVYRAAFRFKDLSHRDIPTGHIYGSFSLLFSLLRHYGEKHDCRLVYALDGKCKWRRELLSSYKANRKPHANGTMIDEVVDLLRLTPGTVVLAPADEADDVIATHCAAYPNKQHVVYSGDRDLWQLSSSHMIRVISSTKDPPITPYQIDEDFYTRNPRLIPLSKAIIGDTSDNVPGVKGFSRDDLRLIMQDLTAPDVDDLIQTAKKLNEAEKLKPRTMRLLVEGAEHIRTMLRVTTLNRSCQYEETPNQPNRIKLAEKLAIEYGCTSLVEKLDTMFGKENP